MCETHCGECEKESCQGRLAETEDMEYCRSYTKSEPLYKDSPSKLGFTKTYFDFIEFHCVFIYYFNKIVIFLKKKYIFQKKNEFIKLNSKLTMCKMMSINSNE